MIARRILNIVLTFFFLFAFFPLRVEAQNNPFKIDNELYGYYQRCEKFIKDKRVLAMADTLFYRAVFKKDLKAQCLAKNLKGDYYYYAGDIKKLIIEQEKIAAFASKTPFKQYVFSSWNRVISYYVQNDMRDEAMLEIQKYQREALRLNNTYGIGNSYKKYSDIYILNGQNDLALQELFKGLDYMKGVGKTEELFNFYSYIGNCYLNVNKYELSKQYYLKAIDSTPMESFKGACYVVLARLYLETGDMDGTKKYISLLNEWKKKYQLTQIIKEKEARLYVKLYTHEKQYEKAMVYCNLVTSPINKLLDKIYIYQSWGKIDSAYCYLAQYSDYVMKQNAEQQQRSLARNVAKFDNVRLENEKNILSLNNARLQLEQLNVKERLLTADRERNLLVLSNTQLELNNKNLALQQQKAESKRQNAEISRQHAEVNRQIALKLSAQQQTRFEKSFTWTISSFLFLLSAALFLYALQRRRAACRLEKEVLRSTEARNEAEKSRMEAEIARQEAEKANNAKSLFIQNMSHEIRTPLNAIVGFSDVLSNPLMDSSEEEKKEFSKLVQDNSRLLTGLINDILDISKLESGRYELHLEKTHIVSLCQSAMASVVGKVPVGVQLLFAPDENDIELSTDPLRVQQLLINLLTNACKYTEKGSITLAYKLEKAQVVFSVSDTGCGIKPENAERIFDRFEKLNQFKQGTGLGLNICRSIADLLHGEVTLDTSYTGGARFLFIHPLFVTTT